MSIRATGINNDLRSLDRENDGKTTITLPELLHPEDDPSWREHAACRNAGVTDFFSQYSYRNAVKICDICTVSQSCLEFALKNEISDGVWGGKLARERKAMKI